MVLCCFALVHATSLGDLWLLLLMSAASLGDSRTTICPEAADLSNSSHTKLPHSVTPKTFMGGWGMARERGV